MQHQLDDEIENEEAPQEIIDEDELNLLTHLKELKKAYRAVFTDLKMFKSQMQSVQQIIDHAKQQLVSDFEAWYGENFEDMSLPTTAKSAAIRPKK